MTHSAEPAFANTSGPKDARIALVGEAFGEDEARVGIPFVGYSGRELTSMLTDAGIERKKCFLTNVFAFRPKDNKIDTLCAKRGEVGMAYALPAISQGKYIRPEFLPEVERLREELSYVRPNVIVALGNTACWALLHMTKIGTIRGTVTESVVLPGQKVLPTYHPASVLRNWSQRPIVLADLLKARREAEFPEIRRLERSVLVNPTLEELEEWSRRPAEFYSVDIETLRGQIECVGFARSPTDSICVPFVKMRAKENSYWSAADEVKARRIVNRMLESAIPKIFQNGLFDMQYLLREGFRLRNVAHDTMLLHHSLYPELQKGLGFLGSVYTNESSWKLMRMHSDEEFKRDE